MTYLELYQKAERGLNRNEITLGEFDKMIEPLNAEITQPDTDKRELVRTITAGIIATSTKDVYSCGMRNGMRWCRALLTEDAPKFEDASTYAQPDPNDGWILCSERMPEEREWLGTERFGTTISDEVYVTFERPDGKRFVKHIMFQNEALSSMDQMTIDAFNRGAKPIAWKPRPEPYMGEVK